MIVLLIRPYLSTTNYQYLPTVVLLIIIQFQAIHFELSYNMLHMRKQLGPFLVMFAASLWALDALIRTELTKSMPSASIVLWEHIIGALLLSPILWKAQKAYQKLTSSDWLNVLFMTVVSSVLGTILFTQALQKSFAFFDFATPLLLQKLQPVFVIVLAALFLKEKLTNRFLALVPLALIGSYMISFGAEPITIDFAAKMEVVLLAIGAAACWGGGTILSKKVLQKLSFWDATALRFAVAIPVAFIFSLFLNQTFNPVTFTPDQIFRFILIAFTTGAGALVIYYKGLQLTQAKVATICELMFPVVSILIAITPLNPYGAPQVLSLANIFGIVILLSSILLISFENLKN